MVIQVHLPGACTPRVNPLLQAAMKISGIKDRPAEAFTHLHEDENEPCLLGHIYDEMSIRLDDVRVIDTFHDPQFCE